MKKRAKVGITIDNFKGLSPSQLLTIISKFGVKFVELTESVFDDLDNVKKAVSGIETGFHLPNLHDFGYDFSHRDKHDHIQNLIALINENYRDLHIQYCLSHPPEKEHGSQPTTEQVEYLLSNLNQLQVPLVIENTQFMSPEQFEKFYRQAQSVLGDKLVGKCFDAPHYLLSGNDPVEFLSQMDGDIFCLHLSDCKNNVDAHLPFGLGGQLPVAEILEKVKQQNFDGFVNLELMPRKLSDIRPLIESYLMVMKTFDYPQYLRSKLQLLLHYSSLTKIVSNAFKE
ncbi:MAG: sugar phosphate isomerase/epimerase [Calditrichaeota bacterium]|nr:sugar phosphate isomerase/epimerase [Calditrichota bacterium]